MTASLAVFPVANGDMTLLTLESGRTILIDIKIAGTADDPDEDTPDVAGKLRGILKRDSSERLYVDVFLLTHPDQDHCLGLGNHFHLGPPEDWVAEDDKILIHETWSSPMVFRRASKLHVLCDDAEAFNKEAKRRVNRFKAGEVLNDGNRVLILGEDEPGHGTQQELDPIIVRVDEVFHKINGAWDGTFSARLLAPHPKSADESEEDARAKNRSSTIINFSLTGGGIPDRCRFLSCGDAGVEVWERLWKRQASFRDHLMYDIMLAPHHCSWRSLSHDSWSDLGEKAKVSEAARAALSQTRAGAVIVASSKAIKATDSDPPCIRAKREYVAIAADAKGSFK